MTKSKTFAVVGGGIGGLTLAIALQKKGFPVKVYEHAPEIKPVGAGIVLAANALKAFRALGMDEEIISAGKEMKRFCIKNDKGNILSKTEVNRILNQFGATNTLTLHRADLHSVLINKLQADTLVLGKGCESFKDEGAGTRLYFKDGSNDYADYVIAADGIHSIFRKKLAPESKIRYSGYTCWRGITDKQPKDFDTEEATESWGYGKRFGIVPLSKGRIYWFATVNSPENDKISNAYSISDVGKLFSDFHSPVNEIISSTNSSNIIKNDIIDVPPMKKFAFGKIVLLGDAAHATTPNLGQGACMAIEDAVVLANCISQNDDPVKAFAEFEKIRIERTTKIVNTSFQMGKIAQVENRLLVKLRNLLIRFTPESVTDKQLHFLFDISFS